MQQHLIDAVEYIAAHRPPKKVILSPKTYQSSQTEYQPILDNPKKYCARLKCLALQANVANPEADTEGSDGTLTIRCQAAPSEFCKLVHLRHFRKII